MRHDILECHQSDPSECLAAFKAKVIDGLDTPGDPAKIGTLVHKVAERLAVAKSGEAFADVFAIARDVIRTEGLRLALSPAALVDAVEIVEAILGDGSRINLWPEMGWQGEAESRWGLRLDTSKGDEGTFVYVADPSEPCYAAGTIDLLEWSPGGAVVRVRDWKTSRQKFSGDDAWESFQARLYAYAMLRRFPEAKSIEFTYGMLRHGYYSRPVDFVRGDPWEWGVETRLRATREQRERALASGSWPESAGPWCSYCPIRWKCASFLAVVAMGDEVPDEWDARTIALALGAAKIAVRDLGKRARSIVEQTQRPIVLDSTTGLALGFKPTNSLETVLTYEQTMDRLRVYGMTKAQEIEHFRFVASNHYAARVKKVASDVLRIGREELESLVVPIADVEFTTFTPDPVPEEDRPVTLDEIDDFLERASA